MIGFGLHVWSTWRHDLLHLEDSTLTTSLTPKSLNYNPQRKSEKPTSRETHTLCDLWTLIPFEDVGLYYVKPIHAWALFLASSYSGNCNFLFLPLSKFPGISIFACCLGNNATETPSGKSDLERVRATPEQHLSFKKSKWLCKLMLSFHWPLLHWIH